MAIVNQDKATIIERAKAQTAIVELNDPSVAVGFWQMADDGTPDYSDPCDLVAVGCLAVVSFEATTGRSRRSSATSCSGTASTSPRSRS